MQNNQPIVLIEDDDVDVLSAQRAIKELNIPNPLVVYKNGEEALNGLREDVGQIPALILLDLNMPRMNGIEFIEQVKSDDTLKIIPVVVLTTSSSRHDVLAAFEHCVAGYMVKPMDYEKFRDLIERIYSYWQHSLLPTNN